MLVWYWTVSYYSKCPRISNGLFHTFLAWFVLLMQLFLKILCRMANSVDWLDCSFRTCLIWVCTVCICHCVSHIGVWNFRTFAIPARIKIWIHHISKKIRLEKQQNQLWIFIYVWTILACEKCLLKPVISIWTWSWLQLYCLIAWWH